MQIDKYDGVTELIKNSTPDGKNSLSSFGLELL